MNVLTINCGSSSIKVRLCAVDGSGVTAVFDGAVEAIGSSAVMDIRPASGTASRTSGAVADHAAALGALMDLLGDHHRRSIEAVGHRVVQGGAFMQPKLVDDEVVRAIEAGRRLAPLHNGPSLQGINADRELLPGIAMVAVFDTTFHETMPAVASQYGLPQELTLKHGLRPELQPGKETRR